MQKIPLTASPLTYEDHLVYTEAALLAHEATQDLAPPVTEQLERFEELWGRERRTRRAQVQAAARIVVADLDLDQGIRVTQNDTLHAVMQNRKATLYRLLFPSPLSTMLRFALGRQVEVAAALVERLGQSIVPAELRERHAAPLNALIAKGREVLAARQKATFDRADFRLDRDAFKAECNNLRISLHAELIKRSVELGKERAWAEAFFLPVSAASNDDEPQTPDDPSPTPETPT